MTRSIRTHFELHWDDRTIDSEYDIIERTPLEGFSRLMRNIPEASHYGTTEHAKRMFKGTGIRWLSRGFGVDVLPEERDYVWNHLCGFLNAMGRQFRELEGVVFHVDGNDIGSPIQGRIVQHQTLRLFSFPQQDAPEKKEFGSMSLLESVPWLRYESLYVVGNGKILEHGDWLRSGV